MYIIKYRKHNVLFFFFNIQVTQWEIIYDPSNVKQMNLLYNITWQCNKGVAYWNQESNL